MSDRAEQIASERTARRRHEHEFHALYWHFGRYGRQDVHLHPCPCGTELVGMGRECEGDGRGHKAKTLTDRSTWSRRENEGKPL